MNGRFGGPRPRSEKKKKPCNCLDAVYMLLGLSTGSSYSVSYDWLYRMLVGLNFSASRPPNHTEGNVETILIYQYFGDSAGMYECICRISEPL
jgi:hypothetical protein